MAFIASIPLRPKTHSSSTLASKRPIDHFRRLNRTTPSRIHTSHFSRIMTTPKAALATGYGQSSDADTAAAVREAISTAKSHLPAAATPTVAIVTATCTRDFEVLNALLQELLPGTTIHGITTHRAILTNDGSVQNGLAVLLLSAPSGVSAAAAEVTDTVSPYEAGALAAAQLPAGVKSAIFHATPGIESEALRGASSVLGESVQLFGGSAADEAVAGDWKLITSSGMFSSGVSLLGVSEGVKFGACLHPPYEPTETSAAITKASGRTIHELDGRRAGDVLKEWVGDSIAEQAESGGSIIVESAGFPLGIERKNGAYVSIHAAEIAADGSIGLFAEAETGERLTVMSKQGGGSSSNAAAIGLEAAYEEARRRGGIENPSAGVAIYCGGLSIAVGDELDDSLKGLKNKAPLIGMTVFGEQGELKGCNLHSNLAVGIGLFE